jgi:phytoene dehydrogenase-like protein
MKRLFRGLRDRAPAERYDAVIVGSGIAGLVSANLLARSGMRVLLVEQHYMAGGYCSTFRRAGYTFDAASHFYPLLGNPDTLTGKLLAEIGSRCEWVLMDPVDTFHLPDGSSFAVPVDLDSYLTKIKGEFPHQREAIDRFFAAVRREYLAGLLRYFRDHQPLPGRQGRDESLAEALDRHFDDPRLKLVLTADCPHWGSPPSRTSFTFDSMLRLSYFLGNYYPARGSQAFVDDLARCFEDAGGDILMSTRVERITLARGRVSGVELDTTRGGLRGRSTVGAPIVVSNADLLSTVDRLVGAEHFPADYVAGIRRLRPTYPCFLTHLGLRDVSAELLTRLQGYYWNTWEAENVGRDALACKIFVPTLYASDLAPQGGHIVILQKVLDLDYAAVDDWAAHKASIEGYLIAHLRRLIPDLDSKVVTASSASARTSNRFTWNRHGAMLGWEMSPQQLGDARPDTTSPIPGLFFTGHWTRPGGGITPVMVSAQRVANSIVGRRNPPFLAPVS